MTARTGRRWSRGGAKDEQADPAPTVVTLVLVDRHAATNLSTRCERRSARGSSCHDGWSAGSRVSLRAARAPGTSRAASGLPGGTLLAPMRGACTTRTTPKVNGGFGSRWRGSPGPCVRIGSASRGGSPRSTRRSTSSPRSSTVSRPSSRSHRPDPDHLAAPSPARERQRHLSRRSLPAGARRGPS